MGLSPDHQILFDVTKTINKLRDGGLLFKSGDKETGTPVRIPGDERETWIRLSVGYETNFKDIIK